MGNKRKVKKLNVNGNKRESERKERKKREPGGRREEKKQGVLCNFVGTLEYYFTPQGFPPTNSRKIFKLYSIPYINIKLRKYTFL